MTKRARGRRRRGAAPAAVAARIQEGLRAHTEGRLDEARARYRAVLETDPGNPDALHLLVSEGLIRRIQPAGSPARFEDRVGDNHHHLICRDCGAVVDVDCAVGSAPCLAATPDMGYEIDEAEVAYWGRCPKCPRKSGRSSRTNPTPATPTRRLRRTPARARTGRSSQ